VNNAQQANGEMSLAIFKNIEKQIREKHANSAKDLRNAIIGLSEKAQEEAEELAFRTYNLRKYAEKLVSETIV